MKLLSRIVLLVALLTSTATYAQEWILAAKSPSSTFYILGGSLRLGQIDSGEKIFYVVGKYEENSSKESETNFWYVTVNHCLAKKGKFVIADSNGKKLTDVDFTFQDNAVASILSKTICTAATEILFKSDKKA